MTYTITRYPIPDSHCSVDDRPVVFELRGKPVAVSKTGLVKITVAGRQSTYLPIDLLALARDGVPIGQRIKFEHRNDNLFDIPNTRLAIFDTGTVIHLTRGHVWTPNLANRVQINLGRGLRVYRCSDVLDHARDGAPVPSPAKDLPQHSRLEAQHKPRVIKHPKPPRKPREPKPKAIKPKLVKSPKQPKTGPKIVSKPQAPVAAPSIDDPDYREPPVLKPLWRSSAPREHQRPIPAYQWSNADDQPAIVRTITIAEWRDQLRRGAHGPENAA